MRNPSGRARNTTRRLQKATAPVRLAGEARGGGGTDAAPPRAPPHPAIMRPPHLPHFGRVMVGVYLPQRPGVARRGGGSTPANRPRPPTCVGPASSSAAVAKPRGTRREESASVRVRSPRPFAWGRRAPGVTRHAIRRTCDTSFCCKDLQLIASEYAGATCAPCKRAASFEAAWFRNAYPVTCAHPQFGSPGRRAALTPRRRAGPLPPFASRRTPRSVRERVPRVRPR